MFGIGGTEFVIIALFALLIFGPDKLPQIARTVGRFVREFKRYQDTMEATIRAEILRAEDPARADRESAPPISLPADVGASSEDDEDEEEEEE